MAKRPTVYDVAEKAKVSIATVSFTFRQPDKVKESTRELVHAAARELGYIPSASARGLARGRTRALGLLSLDHRPVDLERGPSFDPSSADPNADCRQFPLYVDEVQRGVERESWRRGYALLVGGASQANSSAVLLDIAGRVDGLAVFSGTVGDTDLHRTAQLLPVVVLAESTVDDDLSRISVDNTGGMRDLTEHLITSHGARTLQFVGPIHDVDRLDRFNAFRAALRAARLPVPRAPVAADGDHRAMVVDLEDRNALPDAFVCATDEVAWTLMDTLSALGVDVPGTVAVTGFDGLVAGRLLSPQLTTVRQPMAAMGAMAVETLVRRITHPTEPTSSRRFPVQLVLRESCGCSAGDG
ncbi:LacI family DNA-binding transcriptional regulator [Nitriliruptor alkaliphilus]|uniref:LacI family DNA-binding transcriptional regulator n=1 Tax=Nitriliruptor alkaliphilus TaxID=427918 RepID=UPI000695CE7D|nr:LacI family DNA-binding transcriptional regulator [Nitriliruptor alkaliphilus]